MGNDGGSIPTRRELVKNAARNPTLDLETAVSDWRGRLYNYESILKALMPSAGPGGDDDDDAEAAAAKNEEVIGAAEFSFASTGIKSLRDIVKIKDKKGSKKKRKRVDGDKNETEVDGEAKGERVHKSAKKDGRLNGINNPMASSLTAKVLAEQDELNRRRKLAGIVNK
ncbi:unnamed protein product [Parascedosporium putredinis]|uniref:Uncharacterized protein n=1 Tax=Parascedosporium putredinis TaxID=1442378 RepID=A0A9P1M9K3_9PEZI|nr:unnamed protein product [Parascedosporium putredinis]CAI7992205.1 unnamed protein product [Parascedosporium putredinis]